MASLQGDRREIKAPQHLSDETASNIDLEFEDKRISEDYSSDRSNRFEEGSNSVAEKWLVKLDKPEDQVWGTHRRVGKIATSSLISATSS